MVSAAPVNATQGGMQGRSNASNTSKDLPELDGKDITEQLEILHNRLEVENRIKDGAEKILQVIEKNEGKESLRPAVEAQLAQAKAKIADLSAKLDQLRDIPIASRSRKKAAALVNGKRSVFTNQATQSSTSVLTREELADKDDFRTALNQATSLIQTLVSYQQRSSGNSFMIPSPQQSTFTTSSDPSVSPQSVMNDLDVDRSRTFIMTDLVIVLQRNARVKYELDILEVMKGIVPALADYASKESRAAAYRLIRHLIIDHESLQRIASSPYMLDFYIVRTLARDNKHAVEKEQVVKLIRTYVEIGGSRRSPTVGAGNGKVLLSEMVMRSLVAVTEHGEDQFRFVVLETLAEILLIDIDLVARTGAMRVLLQALVDGPHEIAPTLATAFLYILDAPRTRSYLNPSVDIEIALSGLTDSYGKGPSHVEKMRSSSKVILVMLRTWSGLMYLCMNNMRGVSSLINMLRIPSLETREVILDLFFEALNIETPDWFKAYISGRRLTMISTQKRHSQSTIAPPLQGSNSSSSTSPSTAERLNLTHQYIALLLLVFIESGLLDALVGILEEGQNTDDKKKDKEKESAGIGHVNLIRKATLLLGEILEIANTVLPLGIAARIQALPRLFSLATDYCANGESKTVATATLSSIDSFNRNRSKLVKPATPSSRQRANSVEDSVRRGQRQVEQVKVKLGMQIDDKAFQAIIIETGVMMHKEHQKWNFEVLTDLIEGPLMNPKRLEEAIKVSKFGKKLISFFHPFAGRFSTIPNTTVSNTSFATLSYEGG
ncbi:hypothetical protein FRC03_008460 [Tulasnella sp. 419]|nr:hypothetical protein FRC03_008460 [Tulasnella sp. 419]